MYEPRRWGARSRMRVCIEAPGTRGDGSETSQSSPRRWPRDTHSGLVEAIRSRVTGRLPQFSSVTVTVDSSPHSISFLSPSKLTYNMRCSNFIQKAQYRLSISKDNYLNLFSIMLVINLMTFKTIIIFKNVNPLKLILILN